LLICVVAVLLFCCGSNLPGDNDPANFGTVPIAMLSLVQCATLTNWASVALVSFHGCDKFAGNGNGTVADIAAIHNVYLIIFKQILLNIIS
jgi:hypothetical protein